MVKRLNFCYIEEFSYFENLANLVRGSRRLPSDESNIQISIPLQKGRLVGSYHGNALYDKYEMTEEELKSLTVIASPYAIIIMPISRNESNVFLEGGIGYSPKIHYTKDDIDNDNIDNFHRLEKFFEEIFRYFGLLKVSTKLDLDMDQIKFLSLHTAMKL